MRIAQALRAEALKAVEQNVGTSDKLIWIDRLQILQVGEMRPCSFPNQKTNVGQRRGLLSV